MKVICLIMESFFVSSVFWINLWTNPWKIWILVFLVFRKDSLLSMESNPFYILARTAYMIIMIDMESDRPQLVLLLSFN